LRRLKSRRRSAHFSRVKIDGFLFFSGQIAQDPAAGRVVEGGIGAETERVFQNLAAVLSNRPIRPSEYDLQLGKPSQTPNCAWSVAIGRRGTKSCAIETVAGWVAARPRLMSTRRAP
jgi:Endoribonuclease L-PSP